MNQWSKELADFLEILKDRGVTLLPKPTQDPLTTLKEQVLECTKCRLHKSVNNKVFGQGPWPSSVMLVGEGPGADEDATGIPFVGRAGQLLDKILAAVNLHRSQVYITNVIKCRPPMNRTPLPDEVSACKPFLLEQISLVDPAIVVALGSVAARTLLGVEASIARLRGKFYRFQEKRVLLVTYHPAALLRNPRLKVPAWEDWQLFQRAFLEYRERGVLPQTTEV